MDAKLTPEQAIIWLRGTWPKTVQPGIGTEGVRLLREVAALIESLAADAVIGRSAEKCFEDDIDYICGRIYNSSNCKFLRGKKDNNCKWKDFCRLRAGKGGE